MMFVIAIAFWAVSSYKALGAPSNGGQNIRTNGTAPTETPLDLNIRNIDVDKFKVEEFEFNGIKFKEFIPISPYYIEKVMDNDKVVWKSDDPSKASVIAFAPAAESKNSDMILVGSSRGSDDLVCYVKTDGEWISFEMKQYQHLKSIDEILSKAQQDNAAKGNAPGSDKSGIYEIGIHPMMYLVGLQGLLALL